MTMSRQPESYITPEEYLAFERQAEYKNEYFDGEIFAMTGASRKHNLINVNIAAVLHDQLRNHPCEIYSSDMRVRIPNANVYTYPDVAVACGEPLFEDDHVDTLINPILIVEVLSKSTASYDHVKKFGYYRSVASLMEYLLVAQDEYRVEQYTKQSDDHWLLTDIRSLEETVNLVSIQCALPLGEMYRKVQLP
jgi:Uma2 family endonuclease